MITWARRRLAGRSARVRITEFTWASMLSELERRGAGFRESGAFLLASSRSDARRVERVVYFDDLDPTCLVGSIHLSGDAYPRLWDLCAQHSLRVIADVHTHPGTSVRQSSIDAANPMISRRGHVALIVPSFAQSMVRPTDVGVHLYLGAAGWTSSFRDAAARLVYVGRWA